MVLNHPTKLGNGGGRNWTNVNEPIGDGLTDISVVVVQCPRENRDEGLGRWSYVPLLNGLDHRPTFVATWPTEPHGSE